jgi:hypothetical protein
MAAAEIDHIVKRVGGLLGELKFDDTPFRPFSGMLFDRPHKALAGGGKSIFVNLLESRHNYLQREPSRH